jgi:uncharacterized protein
MNPTAANGQPAGSDAPPPTWRGAPVRRMHVMAKPAGPRCNLRCRYCYYLSKSEWLRTDTRWRMSDQVLETFIRQYIQGQNHPRIVFSWQGGEPTLMGLDFFHKVLQLQQRYCPPEVRCENDLQTNGTLLDDAWCEFLHDNRFLVGLSIDGPGELHDAYRTDLAGHGTFDRVLAAVGLLRKHDVPFATLTCVNRLTARHPLKVYRFLRDNCASPRIQFIPIVEPKSFRTVPPQGWPGDAMPRIGTPAARPGTRDSVVEPWSVDPDDFGEFLCRIFDEWCQKDLGRVFVQYFEAAVQVWMGGVSPMCTHQPICGKGLALEHDGSVYACDHYVYPRYRLGNILDRPLEEMAFAARQQSFGMSKHRDLPARCRQCEYLRACFGECPKNRFIRTPQSQPGLNYLCRGWKRFYRHADPYLRRIVRRLSPMPMSGSREESACGPRSPQ